MTKLEDMNLEEKVDELLKYQRKLHRMAVLKTVFSFLTFLVLVVLPIVGIIYVGDYIATNVGLSLQEIGETLKRVKSLTELGGIDSIKGLLN